ncbi:pyruvate dehydrogenase (acetyl-transferring) E1 component subunit alpha [Geomonas sp. Red69]|uniref:pyruvate dehydrogenase (acetyl-transferring) E1 component subunit alpha n=1 Tax=Geomonas diazotrophica TaxID=2843197 RepID=UPI001C0F4F9D|nr:MULTISPECIES: pyruvate dehydrogenase (acetyl-transferring) E1 component subunit alpha [Geomonas]MBU5637425.1 pyruvate dehydrogenase (acetyl-transferring) E1 component subunit alpha [Geomonas diazotrophica]QXE87047.1 pyruvate dehydrogenase (acetyl-transferring) E1 component subunit alpha [Geomonas nitrogeniifigens]
MPELLLADFQIKRLEVLNEKGEADPELLPPLSDAEIWRIYELMLLARIFDERAVALQREGRIGTYPPIRGQEAAQVGSAFALTEKDWLFPSFREMGAHLTLGYPISQLLQYWGGDERAQKVPPHLNIFPFCVAVGSQIPQAAGAALAARYRRDPVAVVTYFGDGATSKGDFHEGMNLAGVFNLPLVFICQNNQWAISIPLKGQTASASLAQKAIAYGFEGVQVDGNDVFAVYRATRQAVEKARSGGGPTFIECLTYRMADHTTADDAGRYRSAEEVAYWGERDPILRLERFLEGRGLWSPQKGEEAAAKVATIVDDGVREMESQPPPAAADLFEGVLATLTPRQAGQRKVR